MLLPKKSLKKRKKKSFDLREQGMKLIFEHGEKIMKNNVYINTPVLDSKDLDEIFKSKYSENTEFDLIVGHGLLPPDTIVCVFLLAQSIGYNAAYDLIKFVLLGIWKAVTAKKDSKTSDETKIQINLSDKNENEKVTNHKTITVSVSYKMDSDERQHVIDMALNSLLSGKTE